MNVAVLVAIALASSPTPVGQAHSREVAPAFIGTQWLNTKKPVRIDKVTIVHFWTLGCINCKRNLPIYNRWHDKFKETVNIVGIHTPELEFEKSVDSVKSAIRTWKIDYPVLVDAGAKNWKAWNQKYWPAIYVLDRTGVVRLKWEGELGEDEGSFTKKIEELIHAK